MDDTPKPPPPSEALENLCAQLVDLVGGPGCRNAVQDRAASLGRIVRGMARAERGMAKADSQIEQGVPVTTSVLDRVLCVINGARPDLWSKEIYFEWDNMFRRGQVGQARPPELVAIVSKVVAELDRHRRHVDDIFARAGAASRARKLARKRR